MQGGQSRAATCPRSPEIVKHRIELRPHPEERATDLGFIRDRHHNAQVGYSRLAWRASRRMEAPVSMVRDAPLRGAHHEEGVSKRSFVGWAKPRSGVPTSSAWASLRLAPCDLHRSAIEGIPERNYALVLATNP